MNVLIWLVTKEEDREREYEKYVELGPVHKWNERTTLECQDSTRFWAGEIWAGMPNTTVDITVVRDRLSLKVMSG